MERNREKLQYMMLKALDGSLCLSEATAKAVQRIPDAKCNGDMHAALNYELEQKHDLENFLTRNAAITAVVQGAKAPSRTNTRRRRFAVEASSHTPHNPNFYSICK